MNVLVTGGTGFVGLNVAEALLARGDRVSIFSNAELPATARDELDALPGELRVVTGDVADGDAVARAMADAAPECVVHAAVITAGEARELAQFDRIVDVNLKGTAHVVAAAADCGVRRVVYVSSGSAYGSALVENDAVDESTPAAPDTLYAITKFASERVCARLRAIRNADVVCARLGSVFGPWERDTGVRDTLSLPFQILARALSGEPVVLPSREPRRDWIYSRDVAAGIVALLDAPALAHDLYNLSGGRGWTGFTVRWCESLKTIYPRFEYRAALTGERPTVAFLGDRDRAPMAVRRLREDAGFAARHDAEAAFADYLAWLQRHPL
ncbi:MAG TPA: NAD(P)-dependent oxidoreductase [Burkholderiales bacterium]|nr:NAD(P)-dependent oxidoreductase [Burkholderiales bacterium]